MNLLVGAGGGGKCPNPRPHKKKCACSYGASPIPTTAKLDNKNISPGLFKERNTPGVPHESFHLTIFEMVSSFFFIVIMASGGGCGPTGGGCTKRMHAQPDLSPLCILSQSHGEGVSQDTFPPPFQ